MINYEQYIIDTCKGETPKQKYDWLITQLAKLSQANTFIKGLKDTPDDCTIGNIWSIIEANYNNITKE